MKQTISILFGMLLGISVQAGLLIGFDTAQFGSHNVSIRLRESVRDISLKGHGNKLDKIYQADIIYTNASFELLSVAHYESNQFYNINPDTIASISNQFKTKGLKIIIMTDDPIGHLESLGWGPELTP